MPVRDAAVGETQRGRGKVRRCAQGLHWFDRVSALNILLDEVPAAPDTWSRAPRFVSFALTNACELRCAHCYAAKSPASLAYVDVIRWAKDLDEEGCLGIGFGGGEPTLHPRFAELCRVLASETQLALSFTTHGHRLTRDLVAALRGTVHFIRVSVDGIGATYELIRGRPFDDVRAAIEAARSIAPVGINVVVNHQTVDELAAIAAFATEMGVTEILLLPERHTDGTLAIDGECSDRLRRWLQSSDTGVRMAISDVGSDLAPTIADPFAGADPLDGHAYVDATGFLRPNAFCDTKVDLAGPILKALDELRRLRG